MKKQNTLFQFKKSAIVELNRDDLTSVIGGTHVGRECFLCIRTSNGPGGTELEHLIQA